jgi:S-adenosylmethionine/arginine decarboxylase-like enzyme
MKVLMGPYAKYLDVVGNRGLTAVAIIETSHIALHVWDEDSPSLMQLDVYTCGPLEPQLVVDAIQEFNPIKVEMKYLDRENNLTELPL